MAEKFDLSVILRFDDKTGKGLNSFSGKMKSLGTDIKSFGKEMMTKVTLPIVALGGFALKSAIDIESAFTGVQKTVNGTVEELAKLKTDIEALSLEIPISPVELFAVAEAAGQLGIETKNIASFTKVMADLGATTNLAGEEAASALAKFANITGMSQNDFDRLGSTIVDLGNKTATTEKDIVAMALRLAGAGNTVGLTEDKILALAASLSSVGIEAEAGGSAFSQVLKKIDKEIGSGSEKMDNFALVAGQATEAFEKKWKDNAASAVLDFIEGLDKAQQAGINVNQILDQLGFEGIRISDALLRASGANEKFRQNQDIANTAWKENIALTKEAELRYKTTSSQLILLKNDIKLLFASFGDVMIPGLREIIKGLKPFIDGLKQISPEMKENLIKVAGVFAVGGPLIVGLGIAAAAIGALLTPVGLVIGSIAAIGAAVAGMIIYWKEFSALLDSPFFTVPLLIFAPFIAIPALIIKHWGPIKEFFLDFYNKLDNPIIAAIGVLFMPLITIPALIIKHWSPIKAFFVEIWEVLKSIGSVLFGEGPGVDVIEAGKKAEKRGLSKFYNIPETALERPKTLSELASIGKERTQTEIVVKVESQNGTSAVVSSIKGDSGIKVENKSTVGPTLSSLPAFDF